MANTAYALKTHDKSREMHLFTGDFTPYDLILQCKTGSKSVCTEVEKEDCSRIEFNCKNEQEARDLCAKIGRKVCANCIKELYKTL
jgi:hypothetical protein